MSITKTTTNVDTLKINYLTQEMYENALENDEINDNELYLTQSETSGILIVHLVYDNGDIFLDKTFEEIWQAIYSGKICYLYYDTSNNTPTSSYRYYTGFYLLSTYKYDTNYRVYASLPSATSVGNVYSTGLSGLLTFGTNTFSNYPKFLIRTYPSDISSSTTALD